MSNSTKIVCLIVSLVVVIGLWVYSDRQAAAQQPFAPPVIISVGVCDPHRAFQAYLRAKDLRDELRKDRDRLNQELKARDTEFRGKTEQLTAGNFVPGSAEYEQRLNELQKQKIDNEGFAKFSDNDLRRREMWVTILGYNDVYAAVEEVAKKKPLTLVLSQEQFSLASQRVEELFGKLYYRRKVLYADKSLDITGEVIELLNTKYKLGQLDR